MFVVIESLVGSVTLGAGFLHENGLVFDFSQTLLQVSESITMTAIIVIDSVAYLLTISLPDINKVRERVVLKYHLQNRVENLADVSTRCSGLLQQSSNETLRYH